MFPSKLPAEISFTIAAPFSTACLATLLLKVSIEIIVSGNDFRIDFIIGITRCNSSSSLTNSAFGLLEYPPISMKVAPSIIIFSTSCKTVSSELNFPPS